jgi:hypothetical protein
LGIRDLQRVMPLLVEQAHWKKNGIFSALAALSSLDALGDKAKPVAAQIKALPREGPASDARYKEYVPRLLEALMLVFRSGSEWELWDAGFPARAVDD